MLFQHFSTGEIELFYNLKGGIIIPVFGK